MARELVIWGAKGHAKVLLDFLAPPQYELVAVFDNDAQLERPVDGIPVRHGMEGFERWHREHGEARVAAIVAVGGELGSDRVELGRQLERAGCELITAVHPCAAVARSARLGKAAQVLVHASVGADASLGEACIVNTAASVDHECELGDGVHVAPGATVAGCVTIGESAFVGAGAVVLPHIRIGARAVVGAGAVVNRDVDAETVVYGNPARTRGSR